MLIPTVILASLLGSLHCAGMCGGMLAICHNGCNGKSWNWQLPYHGGRFLAYTLLGAIAGTVGGALDQWIGARTVQPVVTLVFAGLVIAWGVYALLAASGVRVPLRRKPRTGSGWFRTRVSRVTGLPPKRRALTLGLLSAILPCGWLHAFLLVAAGTGSALTGALVLGAFWIGTVPVLALLGLSIHRVLRAVGPQLPTITALLLISVGVSMLFLRLPTGEVQAAPQANTKSTLPLIEQVENVAPTGECCHD